MKSAFILTMFIAFPIICIAQGETSLPKEIESKNNIQSDGCCSTRQGSCGCKDGRTVCCDGELSEDCSCTLDAIAEKGSKPWLQE